MENLLAGLAHDFAGLIVPLTAVFAFILPLLSKIVKNKLFPLAYTFIITSLVVLATTTIYLHVSSTGKPIVYAFGGWPPPIGISYEIDSFNALLGLYAGWTLLALMLFNAWYNRELDEPEWYYTLFLGFEAGVLGCFYTGDLFNLFVMLEVLSISVYGLIAYHKNNPGSLEAAMKYGILGATATTLYFIGLIIIYGFYGSLNMADILETNTKLYAVINDPRYAVYVEPAMLVSALAVSLALWVFTFKAGLFPNHFWLPDAYCEAPTPVSAALSSLSEIVGVYVVIRILYTVFPASSPLGYMYRTIVLTLLLILGFIGGVIGALMMFTQSDLKRLLGYSSVSHIGLLFIALSIGFISPPDNILRIAFIAVATHIIAHGFGKLLIFSSSEVFIRSAKSKIMDEMRGIGRRYPLVSMAFIAGFLNLMGVIPFIGFFSKLLMYQAYMGIGQVLPAIGIVIVSALSLPGYAKAIYSIVFSTPVREYEDVSIGWYKYYLVILAFILLVLGILFTILYNVFDNLVNNSITSYGYMLYRDAYLNIRRLLGGG